MADNVLITSVGRRGVLVRIFKRAVRGKVFTTDLQPNLAAACQLSDGAFAVPCVTDDDYLPRLIEICREKEIGLIVPTVDTELLVLAKNRERLNGCGIQCLISDPAFVGICRDKRLTHDFFVERGLGTPQIIDPRIEDRFPLFAKPYDGSCSVNTHLIKSRSDLTPSILADPTLIFLDCLSLAEHDEYTIDMYYGREGELKCLVPRLRLETRGGEVSKGRTAWLSQFEAIREKLFYIDGARGCLTAQFFVNHESGDLSGIEINPRFGGGFPLSCDSGANYAEWAIKEYLLGESIPWFDDWERNLTMLRYDDHVIVRSAVG
jgi:carbamoyl-phosphate synthase large subunit